MTYRRKLALWHARQSPCSWPELPIPTEDRIEIMTFTTTTTNLSRQYLRHATPRKRCWDRRTTRRYPVSKSVKRQSIS